MMISFRLNKRNDNELILLLSKYENNNMSEFIRGVLRGSLLVSKSNDNVVEDVFASDTINDTDTDNNKFATAFNTDNDNINVEIRQINRKTDINNSNNNCNKKESIKWNFPL